MEKQCLQYILDEMRSMTRDLTIFEIRPQIEGLRKANEEANESLIDRDRKIQIMLDEREGLFRKAELCDHYDRENERLNARLAALADETTANDYRTQLDAQCRKIEELEAENVAISMKREAAIMECDEVRREYAAFQGKTVSLRERMTKLEKILGLGQE